MDELKMFDIVYADFTNSKIGSEQSGIHPYIIIQNNMGNKYCPTVLGMSLTVSAKYACGFSNSPVSSIIVSE